MTVDGRRRAAEMARELQQGVVSGDAFLKVFGSSEDAVISELVDLLEHQPRSGGFMGASKEEFAAHQEEIERVIGLLEVS